jgi:signal transduction histidine kinase
VDDLAELARFESQSFILEKTRFDLSILIENTINHFHNDFAKDNKSLTHHGNSLFIFADMDKLSQVLINLLSNAMKFTKPGDSVEVYHNESNNGAEIIISDTGAGISDEDLPHIFERFYRSDKSRSRKTGGAGIGLTIVRSIVLAHGGSIKVSSKLNKGTEFIITLPKETV